MSDTRDFSDETFYNKKVIDVLILYYRFNKDNLWISGLY